MLGDDVHRAAAALGEQRQDPPLLDVGAVGLQGLLQPLLGGPSHECEETEGLVVDLVIGVEARGHPWILTARSE
ncbi:hypothetical protein ACFQV8_20345 [Pseudonocardia benzenivorans]